MKFDFKKLDKINFKKNQVLIYTIALMLVVAGYLNYTGSNSDEEIIQASTDETVVDETIVEDIASNDGNVGDAQLVNSNDVSSEDNSVIGEALQDNTVVENTVSTSAKTTDDSDYFVSSKLERDTMYSQMIETYENILNSSNATETQKQSATEEITKINNTKNAIMISENLIKTKGFNNSLIFVNGESVSCVIKADSLTKEEVAQIQNIISRELNADIENIHISNK